MQHVTACVEESEERQDCDLIFPPSPLGCRSGGPSSEGSRGANVTEFAGTRVVLLVLLTTGVKRNKVQLSLQRQPESVVWESNAALHFLHSLQCLCFPKVFTGRGRMLPCGDVAWGGSVGLLDAPAASPEN